MAKHFLIAGLVFLMGFLTVARAEQWTLVKEESFIRFSGFQIGRPFEGEFREFSASICFEEDNLAAASISLVIDMESATTGILERDEILKAPEWMDSAGYPTATFRITAIERLGPDSYQGNGFLEMKGVSREVTLPFILNLVDNTASGSLTIDRRDFDIGEGRWGETEQWVGFEIEINFTVTAIPTGAACEK